MSTEERDLGPLAWISDEVRRSLEVTIKALNRYIRDVEAAKASDLEAVDSTGIRMAKQSLHQVQGALQMVGGEEPAHLVSLMEAAAQRFAQKPHLCTEKSVALMERASFALLEYLSHVLKGRAISFVALFPQYKELQELVGVDRVHPADLWHGDATQQEPQTPVVAVLALGRAARERLDVGMLHIIKSADSKAATDLTQVCLGLAQGQAQAPLRLFWKVAAGFFDALAHKLLSADLYVKRSASRVIMQFAMEAKGSTDVDKALLHELNFFCAAAQDPEEEQAVVLQAVRASLQSADLQGVNYTQERFGLYDPAVLAQARKRIESAAELWSSLADGDRYKIKPVSDQFHLLRESLHKLHIGADELGAALGRVTENLVSTGASPSASLAMEVATAILYLQANLESLDVKPDLMRERAHRLAQRLDHVLAGQPAEPLEPWVEELYRKVSDNQTMGSVVDELRSTLSDVEKHLDQHFRNPEDVSMLAGVTGSMSQMRGVLSVLGLDQAAAATQYFRGVVEQLAVGQVADDDKPAVFEKLGSSLGALGFLLDMLGYQRTLARKLFVFDAAAGELRIVMGTQKEGDEPSVVAPVQDMVAPAAVVMQAMPAPVPIAEEVDDELLDIFLEEAQTVVQTGSQALQALRRDPNDAEALTTVRRAFHTLKGSSRMVGLMQLGEAAWSMEQVMNTWLAEHRPASGALLALSTEALGGFGRWAEDIGAQRNLTWNPDIFRISADAMRLDGTHIPLVMPASALSESAELQLNDAVEAEEFAADPDRTMMLALPELSMDDEIESKPVSVEATPELELPEPAAQDHVIANAQQDAGAALAFEWPLESADLDLNAVPAAAAVSVSASLAPDSAEEVDFAEFAQAVADNKLEDAPAVEPLDIGVGFVGVDDAIEFVAHDETPVFEAETKPEKLLLELPSLELVQAPEVQFDVVPPVQIEVVSETTSAPALEPQLLLAEPGEEGSLATEETENVLGVSTALFNVYLTEAEEWSHSLEKALFAWGNDSRNGFPGDAIAYAHSLAGSSSTVGFSSLSELARALEHALAHVQYASNPEVSWLNTFQATGSEIRKLLHQVAAGFVKPGNEIVLADLQQIAQLDIDSSLHPPYEHAEAGAFADPSEMGELAAMVEAAAASAIPAPAPLPISLDVAVDHQAEAVDIDDVIDPDLFLIFEEEAQELLPKLGMALREWSSDPNYLLPRGEVLRHLHTLKGSARLAGAMRLGEMSHRMESEVEDIGIENLTHQDIDVLLTRYDGLQYEFVGLQQRGNQVLAEGALPQHAAAATDMGAVVAEVVASAPVPQDEFDAPVAEGDAAQADKGVHHKPLVLRMAPVRVAAGQSVRVRSQLLDRLVNEAGEVLIARSRLDMRLSSIRSSIKDMSANLERLRNLLRDVEVQAESQMQSRMAQAKDTDSGFDPLEFDRFTRVQELTRMMAESVNDVGTVQRNLQRTAEGAEDDLIAQGRQARELQRDLLRTRMVEFDSVSERLYAIVRQISKELGKQVKLDITGGAIEIDRGVLDRVTPAFEHLLRNSVAHGIETPELRKRQNKSATGTIAIEVKQEGNDIAVYFKDDGAGLQLERIRQKAVQSGLITSDEAVDVQKATQLIFAPGFSTASAVSDISGRGIGMDVVRTEIQSLGGHIVTTSEHGKGTTFQMVMPLTTAVTQVVMMRVGDIRFGVPANLVEYVRRVSQELIDDAHISGIYKDNEDELPYYYAGALLQSNLRSNEAPEKTSAVVILRSAAKRVAVHVDEVLGNQEVVVKNLGPQLARLPGLAGMSVLASGAIVLIYNPVALYTVYGAQVAERIAEAAVRPEVAKAPVRALAEQVLQTPLVLVVDDSITVRRVTQRLLQREGYRVALAADGLQALDRLREERPVMVLSDIEMPRMDGFELVREIRADDALKDLPVVMITSRIADKHREHAASLGVDHYLGKPYSDDVLLSLVRQYALEGEIKAADAASEVASSDLH
ncbi:MAG: Hpt domain-containing protein [Comamonas sp.]